MHAYFIVVLIVGLRVRVCYPKIKILHSKFNIFSLHTAVQSEPWTRGGFCLLFSILLSVIAFFSLNIVYKRYRNKILVIIKTKKKRRFMKHNSFGSRLSSPETACQEPQPAIHPCIEKIQTKILHKVSRLTLRVCCHKYFHSGFSGR